jgi:hypothetical protein
MGVIVGQLSSDYRDLLRRGEAQLRSFMRAATTDRCSWRLPAASCSPDTAFSSPSSAAGRRRPAAECCSIGLDELAGDRDAQLAAIDAWGEGEHGEVDEAFLDRWPPSPAS